MALSCVLMGSGNRRHHHRFDFEGQMTALTQGRRTTHCKGLWHSRLQHRPLPSRGGAPRQELARSTAHMRKPRLLPSRSVGPASPTPQIRTGLPLRPAASGPGSSLPRPPFIRQLSRRRASPQKQMIGHLESRAQPRANPRQEARLCPLVAAPTLSLLRVRERPFPRRSTRVDASTPPHRGLAEEEAPRNLSSSAWAQSCLAPADLSPTPTSYT